MRMFLVRYLLALFLILLRLMEEISNKRIRLILKWTKYQVIQSPFYQSPFYPLVRGHLTFQKVTQPSQKGNKELLGNHFENIVDILGQSLVLLLQTEFSHFIVVNLFLASALPTPCCDPLPGSLSKEYDQPGCWCKLIIRYAQPMCSSCISKSTAWYTGKNFLLSIILVV